MPEEREVEGGEEKNKFKNIRCSSVTGEGRVGLVSDDRLQIGSLSPLFPAVAIGSGGSDICHLFALIQHGLGEINALHGVERKELGEGE